MANNEHNLPAAPATGTKAVDRAQGTALTTFDQSVEIEAARARAEIEGMIILARRFPRDLDRATDELGKLCLKWEFAHKAFYSYDRAGTEICGPSVWLARQAGARYGNVTAGARVLRNDGETVLVEGYAWDLETNTRISEQAQFKYLIYRKATGWKKPDERDGRELINKHGAICIRNALLALLPKDYIEDAFALCRNTVSKGEPDNVKRVRKCRAMFSEVGVGGKRLEKWLSDKRDVERAPIASLTDEEFAELVGIFNGILDGQVDVYEVFPEVKDEGDDEDATTTAKVKPSKQPYKGHEDAPKGDTEVEPPAENASQDGTEADDGTNNEDGDTEYVDDPELDEVANLRNRIMFEAKKKMGTDSGATSLIGAAYGDLTVDIESLGGEELGKLYVRLCKEIGIEPNTPQPAKKKPATKKTAKKSKKK